jgi:tRNA G46 methylase TrmB
MAKDNNKTAYIGIEREDNSLKYIAKVFNEPPCQITKAQYNAIVKSLREQDWANSVEDEASIISKIISSNLETTDSPEL